MIYVYVYTLYVYVYTLYVYIGVYMYLCVSIVEQARVIMGNVLVYFTVLYAKY